MVDYVLRLAETWPRWDGRPCEVPVEGEQPRIYTPHKAIRRVADQLVDHLAGFEGRLAGQPTSQTAGTLRRLLLPPTSPPSPPKTSTRPAACSGGLRTPGTCACDRSPQSNWISKQLTPGCSASQRPIWPDQLSMQTRSERCDNRSERCGHSQPTASKHDQLREAEATGAAKAVGELGRQRACIASLAVAAHDEQPLQRCRYARIGDLPPSQADPSGHMSLETPADGAAVDQGKPRWLDWRSAWRVDEFGLVEQAQPASVGLAADDLSSGARPRPSAGRGEGYIGADERRQWLFWLEVGAACQHFPPQRPDRLRAICVAAGPVGHRCLWVCEPGRPHMRVCPESGAGLLRSCGGPWSAASLPIPWSAPSADSGCARHWPACSTVHFRRLNKAVDGLTRIRG
jgi:hypothetical protein